MSHASRCPRCGCPDIQLLGVLRKEIYWCPACDRQFQHDHGAMANPPPDYNPRLPPPPPPVESEVDWTSWGY